MGGDHHSLWCSHHHSYNSYTEKHLWQASVDEYYSVVFSTALSCLKCCSAKSGVHIHLSGIHASTLHVSAPPLMEVLHYSTLNAINMQWFYGASIRNIRNFVPFENSIW